MKTDLYLRFKGADQNNTSDIPLEDLGRSLIGFNRVIRQFASICRLDARVEIVATSKREGSLIVDTLVQIEEYVENCPIESTEHVLEFLQLWGKEMWTTGTHFFNELQGIHRTANDFFKEHPLDLAVFIGLIPYLIQLARKQKDTPLPADSNIPERIAKELHNYLQRNGFGQAIYPIINETVVSIDVSTDRNFKTNSDKIDQSNYEELMGKDSEILPEMKDGEEYELEGEITSLKSTRGDSLTFHYESKEKTHNLILYPPKDKTTKSYVGFYKEQVRLWAMVDRESMFKKPKLHMIHMELLQTEFDFEA